MVTLREKKESNGAKFSAVKERKNAFRKLWDAEWGVAPVDSWKLGSKKGPGRWGGTV